MKKIKIALFAITIVLAFSLVFTACEGPEGPMGPQGEQGPQGDPGAPGQPGTGGTQIAWKGNHAAPPDNPEDGWLYYNTADKASYIYLDGVWNKFAADGTPGTGNDPRIVSVTYHGNGHTGGTMPLDWHGFKNTSITLPTAGTGANRLIKPNLVFDGWQTASGEMSGDKLTGSYTVTGDITLYVRWIPGSNVTFNGNGNTGGNIPALMTAVSGGSITLPERGTLVRTGYIYDGWQTAIGEMTGEKFSGSYTPTGDITFYARWQLCDHSGAVYTVTDTTSFPAKSTILGTCSVCAATTNLSRDTQLGDTGPGGGKIFYIAPGGITVQGYGTVGTDVGAFATYTAHYLEAAPANLGTSIAWASSGFTSTDITGTVSAIGTGRKNTAIILATNSAAPAALACVNYSSGDKTDWFLPSQDELQAMENNRVLAGIPTSAQTWSSTQTSNTQAWARSIGITAEGGYTKTMTLTVRAIRAF